MGRGVCSGGILDEAAEDEGGSLGCYSPSINSLMEMKLLAPWSPIQWE